MRGRQRIMFCRVIWDFRLMEFVPPAIWHNFPALFWSPAIQLTEREEVRVSHTEAFYRQDPVWYTPLPFFSIGKNSQK